MRNKQTYPMPSLQPTLENNVRLERILSSASSQVMTSAFPYDTLILDPSYGALTVTLPKAEDVIGRRFKIKKVNSGNNWIDRGDCESTNSPMVRGETTPILSNATFARDATLAFKGSYSYKYTKTIAAGSSSYITFVDSALTTDLHDLSVSTLYEFSLKIYIPSSVTIVDNISIVGGYCNSGAWVYTYFYFDITKKDQWQTGRISFYAPSSATGVSFSLASASSNALNTYFQVDDVKLFKEYDITVNTQQPDMANGSNNSLSLVSNQNELTITAVAAEKWRMDKYYCSGATPYGTYEKFENGKLLAKGVNTATRDITSASGGLYYISGGVSCPYGVTSKIIPQVHANVDGLSIVTWALAGIPGLSSATHGVVCAGSLSAQTVVLRWDMEGTWY